MLKILCAGFLGLSQAILVQFTHEMYVAVENCKKKVTKNPILGVQGG